MAYAAVISLQKTIECLVNSCISLVPPSAEIIGLAYEELKSLQETLKRLDSISVCRSRKRVNALDAQIREAVSIFEDVLESHVLNQLLSHFEESFRDEASSSLMHAVEWEEARQDINSFAKLVTKLDMVLGGMSTYIQKHRLLSAIDLQDLKQDTHSFIETVRKLKEEYAKELDNALPDEEEDEEDGAVSSRIDFGGKKSKMVGFSDVLSKIRGWLTGDLGGSVTLVGMAGIGKTTVAREIFEDPLILSRFEHRVWVTVGRKYQLNEVIRSILAQLDLDTGIMLTEGDKGTADYLKKYLKSKRSFFVLDDLWDAPVWDYMRRILPLNNGSAKLLTTRLEEMARAECTKYMRLLNNNESWDLFCEKVFGEKELCPPLLEKVGKKIAENCDGLPLTIVTVADFLSKAEKDPDYWNKVAEKQNSVFKDAYDKFLKVLYPSYEYLDQHLKAPFLYMAVFPEKHKISRSKLSNLWIAEGFLEPDRTQSLEDCAEKYLSGLISNSLVTFRQRSSNWRGLFDGHIKNGRVHSSFWHLCNRVAGKNKFFHVLSSLANGLEEGITSQRRLCIHNNILFGIKDMHKSMEDNCASTARSLLCFGPYNQYLVPICFGLRFLRVLDALKIRFYEFPMEVLKLIELRYLSITYNGELPTSISKLWKLQFLIVHRHLSTKSFGAASNVPLEIWDMQELKHIEIMGSNFSNSNCGASLHNLLALLGVTAHSCTKGVLKRISNLKKLGIQIELAPDDDSNPFNSLNHIFILGKLDTLKCVVVNPELRSKILAPPTPILMFPSSLRKLHLCGLGYPWEYMSIIGSLSNLEVLKLRCYAFQGTKWEINDGGFLRLRFLLIQDTDLVQWKVARGSLTRIKCLRIKHCYKLEELHWEIDRLDANIEVVDSNPLAVNCVNQIQLKIKDHNPYTFPHVHIHSSWDDGNLKS